MSGDNRNSTMWLAIFSFVLLGMITFFGVAPAPAQDAYRSNVPGVVTPDAKPQSRDLSIVIMRAFADVYQRRGRPKLVVFWNRELSDRVGSGWSEETVENRQLQNEDVTSSTTTQASDEQMTLEESMSTGQETATSRTKSEAIDYGARQGLAESSDWKLSEGFRSAMLAVNVVLIDRAALMRLTGKDATGERPNRQAIEAQAVAAGGDYLLELLLDKDPASPTGMVFRVEVLDVRSGQLLASTLTHGMPPLHGNAARYVATSSGFEMAPSPKLMLNDIGHQVALDVMRELTAIW